MANRDIVAIGASAGGIEALQFLARELSADFPAAILVTIHLSSRYPSSLDTILSESGPLAASFATDGERVEHGRIYIAPAERHLLLEGDRLALGSGPRENHARPAIDPMFRSAAVCCGFRAVGVILTGSLYDGAAGLLELKASGGLTLVQDPADAARPDMPLAALRRLKPDHVACLAEIPDLLEALARQPAGEPKPVPERLATEVGIAKNRKEGMSEMDRLGLRSTFSCPDCGGVMWEIDEAGIVRYRCHVGHAYTAERMSAEIDENLKTALGSAVRALDERIGLAKRLQARPQWEGRLLGAESWNRELRELEQQSRAISEAIRWADAMPARSAALASQSEQAEGEPQTGKGADQS